MKFPYFLLKKVVYVQEKFESPKIFPNRPEILKFSTRKKHSYSYSYVRHSIFSSAKRAFLAVTGNKLIAVMTETNYPEGFSIKCGLFFYYLETILPHKKTIEFPILQLRSICQKYSIKCNTKQVYVLIQTRFYLDLHNGVWQFLVLLL